MNIEYWVGAIVVVPAMATLLLALILWFSDTPSERFFSFVVGLSFSAVLASAGIVLGWMLATGQKEIVVSLGNWFSVDSYHFEWVLVADRLSLPFTILNGGLVGLIGVFSRRYLHREPGFFRFYFLLALFGAGVELIVLAGNLDLVFIGWEVVGLTSALLIAFFLERENPVEHGLRAFITYRFCDVALLSAAVWMHHIVGGSEVLESGGTGHWNGFPVPDASGGIIVVGLLILVASMGKAAQVPLGGWLPRAMEGPTPSSAIFYGAISIHLGPYLLLRAAPILEASIIVQVAVITIGALTAIHASFVGRVQTDIKSALAYASMTQVGIIFVEIGFGLRYVALIHIIGHAAMRSLQILRSPSLLHDHHQMEQAMGTVLPRTGEHFERLLPDSVQPWLYRHALERGYFEVILNDWIVGNFVRFFRALDIIDQGWVRRLAGAPPTDTQEKGEEQ